MQKKRLRVTLIAVELTFVEIETIVPQGTKEAIAGRDRTKSLVGIETSSIHSGVSQVSGCRDRTKSLVGIETG